MTELRAIVLVALAVVACSSVRDGAARTESMGTLAANVIGIKVQARRELVENSGITMSGTQPGVFFTINDSGNEPLLFAIDTAGADRGVWRVAQSRNIDWEAVSVGPCGHTTRAADGMPNECVYVGDVGDNDGRRPARVIYRVGEPTAERAGFVGSLDAESLTYRYSDGSHDVEAMYVAPNGNTFLITKRRLRSADGQPRPALVFELPASAWGSAISPVVADLVDSLPIVPGSADRRQITDAALSQDGRRLAVRTYGQIFTFATDSATGRVDHGNAPGVCDLAALGRWQGEGVTWYGRGERLVLSSEGRNSPLFAVDCPLPRATP